MKKTVKQILVLVLIVMLFAAFNASIYALVTQRCGINFDTRIIEPERYLPFDANAGYTKVESDLLLDGDIPVIDGAAALVPVYSSIVDSVYPQESVKFDTEAKNYTQDSAIRFTDTIKAYKGVTDGTVDIILCAAPSEQQKQYAKDQGVELVYVPVGYEAFVFFVNENNPVDDLTVSQIKDIYAGEITNWAEVGGADRIINPLDRPEGSGSQTVMLKFMGDREIKKNPFGIFGGAIGFSFRFYVEGVVANGGIKLLSVNGIEPTEENIRNGSYPIIYQFYAVYRKDNQNENVQKLVDFILSEDGQKIIDENGYTPIK
jgi:phosphate transport system substrate-binding protein